MYRFCSFGCILDELVQCHALKDKPRFVNYTPMGQLWAIFNQMGKPCRTVHGTLSFPHL